MDSMPSLVCFSLKFSSTRRTRTRRKRDATDNASAERVCTHVRAPDTYRRRHAAVRRGSASPACVAAADVGQEVRQPPSQHVGCSVWRSDECARALTRELQAIDRLAAGAARVREVAALQLQRGRQARSATASAQRCGVADGSGHERDSACACEQAQREARAMKLGITRWKMEPLLRGRKTRGRERSQHPLSARGSCAHTALASGRRTPARATH
jgi:hypothetical protein